MKNNNNNKVYININWPKAGRQAGRGIHTGRLGQADMQPRSQWQHAVARPCVCVIIIIISVIVIIIIVYCYYCY